METGFERQLKKGVLEMLVLGLVCETPTYGYDLMAQTALRSGGFLQVREGTLYPILYRLEDAGLIRSEWRTQPGRGAPKKYYTATDEGRAALVREHAVWRALTACMDSFFEPHNDPKEES